MSSKNVKSALDIGESLVSSNHRPTSQNKYNNKKKIIVFILCANVYIINKTQSNMSLGKYFIERYNIIMQCAFAKCNLSANNIIFEYSLIIFFLRQIKCDSKF